MPGIHFRFAFFLGLIATYLVTGCAPSSPEAPADITSNNLPKSAVWWQPLSQRPIHWHWQLSDPFVIPRDVRNGITVYDLDGELTTAETVAQLHALSPEIRVICYIEVGAFESYRSDADRFPEKLIGNSVKGWPDTYWLDIRQTEILIPIITARIQDWCKDKGFDAIEPDDSEVWSNDSGFSITKDQNHAFLRKIAEITHSLNLSIGLKNNTAEAVELEPYFDWALVESCWLYEECESLRNSFIEHGKAVFNVEYENNPDCQQANAWHMNSVRRDLNLVGPLNPAYLYRPCLSETQDSW